MNNDLKLYFVVFSVHQKDKSQWAAHAGYIFAYDRSRLDALLKRHYGDIVIRTASEVIIKEGTVLYGERWTAL